MNPTNSNPNPLNNPADLPAWDLSDLYQNTDDPAVASDLELYKDLNLRLAERFKGKIKDISPADFFQALDRKSVV